MSSFRAWRRKLNVYVKDPQHSEEIYASLLSLIREGNRGTFNANMELFVQNWYGIQPDFVQYFQSTYVGRKG